MTSPQATQAPGVTFDASGRKVVVPLENNPEVFTHLIHSLGVSPELGFYDIYSLDPELTSFIPRPVHSIIFIAPSDVYYKLHGASPNVAVQDLKYSGSGDNEPVIWFSQTIGNSCGLMALIHCVANGTAKKFVQPPRSHSSQTCSTRRCPLQLFRAGARTHGCRSERRLESSSV
jgi:ubiquitin carboxyl-terminal hydrolase L3